jgi:hypothetical protein
MPLPKISFAISSAVALVLIGSSVAVAIFPSCSLRGVDPS